MIWVWVGVVGVLKLNWFSRHGFDATNIVVSCAMFLIQLAVGLVGIPLAIHHSTPELYGVLVVVTGGPLGFLVTWGSSKILSLTSPEYVELSKVLERAQNGWVNVQSILSVKTERHIRTDLATTTMLDSFRNGIFLIVQVLLILGIDYALYSLTVFTT